MSLGNSLCSSAAPARSSCFLWQLLSNAVICSPFTSNFFLLQATTIQVWARDTGIHLVAKYYTIFCKVSRRKLRVLRCIGQPS